MGEGFAGLNAVETLQVALVMLWAALAVARMTRLVTQDEITRPLRGMVLRRLNDENPVHLKLAYLLECPWCVSIWVGAAVFSAVAMWPGSVVLWIALSTFAASQITGTIGDIGFYLRNRHRFNEDE